MKKKINIIIALFIGVVSLCIIMSVSMFINAQKADNEIIQNIESDNSNIANENELYNYSSNEDGTKEIDRAMELISMVKEKNSLNERRRETTIFY